MSRRAKMTSRTAVSRARLNFLERCYSITRSALTSIDCGIVIPSALAVFMFTTRSNLVGCCPLGLRGGSEQELAVMGHASWVMRVKTRQRSRPKPEQRRGGGTVG